MADTQRLDTPGRSRGWGPKLRLGPDAFGQFAEWIARYLGSPSFIIWMTVFIILWILWNTVTPWQFDEAPSFIMLTLMLSIEAAYSAPLLLLAQNRQEERDRRSMEDDRRVAAQSRADMDFLAREIASLRSSVGELASRDFVRTEIRDQLRELLEELDRADKD
uniref:DUF1003 domain-containing protein n=1 Tax=Vaginimicrobium propionicum TaxID=1871034 RepID=UPI000970675C|nr:DUF1003 domain-containing protein [Vaginimicrobium propionicum]